MKPHLKLQEKDHERIALYLLGTLSKPDEMKAHLELCALCREEVRALTPVLIVIGELAPEVAPPLELKAKLFDRLGLKKQVGAEPLAKESSA